MRRHFELKLAIELSNVLSEKRRNKEKTDERKTKWKQMSFKLKVSVKWPNLRKMTELRFKQSIFAFDFFSFLVKECHRLSATVKCKATNLVQLWEHSQELIIIFVHNNTILWMNFHYSVQYQNINDLQME